MKENELQYSNLLCQIQKSESKLNWWIHQEQQYQYDFDTQWIQRTNILPEIENKLELVMLPTAKEMEMMTMVDTTSVSNISNSENINDSTAIYNKTFQLPIRVHTTLRGERIEGILLYTDNPQHNTESNLAIKRYNNKYIQKVAIVYITKHGTKQYDEINYNGPMYSSLTKATKLLQGVSQTSSHIRWMISNERKTIIDKSCSFLNPPNTTKWHRDYFCTKSNDKSIATFYHNDHEVEQMKNIPLAPLVQSLCHAL